MPLGSKVRNEIHSIIERPNALLCTYKITITEKGHFFEGKSSKTKVMVKV